MRGVNVVVVAVAALTISCDDGAVGKQCQPGDTAFCGDGYQCLSFCDKDSRPQSICTPSFGAEAGDTFSNEALIDGKIAFGQLANVRHFRGDATDAPLVNLRIEIGDVKGVVLPLLEDVSGDLTVVSSTELECLSMPRLRSVGGLLTLDVNEKLERLELGALKHSKGLIMTENNKLKQALLNSVVDFGGDVVIDRNAALEEINFESLTAVTASEGEGEPAPATMTITNNNLSSSDDTKEAIALDQLTTACFDIVADDGALCIGSKLPVSDVCCVDASLSGCIRNGVADACP